MKIGRKPTQPEPVEAPARDSELERLVASFVGEYPTWRGHEQEFEGIAQEVQSKGGERTYVYSMRGDLTLTIRYSMERTTVSNGHTWVEGGVVTGMDLTGRLGGVTVHSPLTGPNFVAYEQAREKVMARVEGRAESPTRMVMQTGFPKRRARGRMHYA